MLYRIINWFANLGSGRSSQWPAVRKKHLEKEPNCCVCNSKEELNVHHIIPFHIDATKELDENNLITLCEKNNCHFLFGHYLNWKSYNPTVVKDSKEWRERIKNRPK